MSIHDISLPISESLFVWPGDPAIQITQPSHLDRGDEATVSRLDMGAHTGTHVDAPAHFVRGGAGVDSLALDLLVGPALVVHALGFDALSGDVLEGLSIPGGIERVLFCTRNSERWARGETEFWTDYVGITDDPKRRLVEHNTGESPSTWKYRPWKLVWYCWFRNAKVAQRFEEYLKSGSGRTFSKRHLY